MHSYDLLDVESVCVGSVWDLATVCELENTKLQTEVNNRSVYLYIYIYLGEYI